MVFPTVCEASHKVGKALEEMCYAEIPAAEFAITMENLVQARFISQEYADHYMEVRNKTGKKTVATTYRR